MHFLDSQAPAPVRARFPGLPSTVVHIEKYPIVLLHDTCKRYDVATDNIFFLISSLSEISIEILFRILDTYRSALSSYT